MDSNPIIPKPIERCIKDKDPICVNCRFYIHLIALGLGIRCNHKSNWSQEGLPPLLPSRYHSCQYFSLREVK